MLLFCLSQNQPYNGFIFSYCLNLKREGSVRQKRSFYLTSMSKVLSRFFPYFFSFVLNIKHFCVVVIFFQIYSGRFFATFQQLFLECGRNKTIISSWLCMWNSFLHFLQLFSNFFSYIFFLTMRFHEFFSWVYCGGRGEQEYFFHRNRVNFFRATELGTWAP